MRNYKQVALVVRDVQATMEHYWNILGIGPWDVRSFNPSTVRDFYVDGQLVTEDFEFIIAVCWVGNLELELVQPVKGPQIYGRFLAAKGEGLHHVKDVMPDAEIPDIIKRFADQGVPIMQTGWIDNDVHYYFDTTTTLGMIYEVGNGGKIGPAPRRYPPDQA